MQFSIRAKEGAAAGTTTSVERLWHRDAAQSVMQNAQEPSCKDRDKGCQYFSNKELSLGNPS